MLNETIRRDMNTVEISLSSEVRLCRIFGTSMYLIHGNQSQRTWKNILKKATKTIRKAIKFNVNSDNFHKNQINNHLVDIEEALSSRHNVDPQIILSLIGMIFELLGNEPNYWRRKRLTRKTDFVLNKLRSLQYIQSPKQKVQTILEASKYAPFAEKHKHNDLLNDYYTHFNGNPDGFIEWYKEKYPDIYLKLF